MNAYIRARIDELKAVMGPLFSWCAIPGGVITVWPTDTGYQALAIQDREFPRGELREVPVDGSNRRFRFRFHYPDDQQGTADSWQHLIASVRDG